MPLYEYLCSDCHHDFEFLVYGSQSPSCPECQSTKLEKRFSVFAVNAQNTPRPNSNLPGECGTCGDPRGPGACSLGPS